MLIRTLALAGALTVGMGSAAMAQGVAVETPFGGFGVGVGPAPYVYDSPYVYDYGRGYYYEPNGWSWRGDRADADIFNGSAAPWAAEDDYENQTGINR